MHRKTRISIGSEHVANNTEEVMAKRRINTQGNKARPDLVSVPFTEEEIATLRALQDELRESNVGPEQLAADVRESREKHERHHRQSRNSFWERMGKAYAAVVSALARDEVDDLRRAMGVEGGDDPSPDPSLIKDVLDYGGELPSDTLTKRGAAVRWALRSGCEPADAPAFFKREGGITGCYQKWLKATPREPALNEAAARQDGAEGGHDRGPSAADAKPAKSAKEEAARSSATPPSEDAGTAPVARNRLSRRRSPVWRCGYSRSW